MCRLVAVRIEDGQPEATQDDSRGGSLGAWELGGPQASRRETAYAVQETVERDGWDSRVGAQWTGAGIYSDGF